MGVSYLFRVKSREKTKVVMSLIEKIIKEEFILLDKVEVGKQIRKMGYNPDDFKIGGK